MKPETCTMNHQDFLTLLKAESDLLTPLIEFLRQQQAALVSGDSALLVQCSQQAEALLKSLQNASQERMKAQSNWESLEQVTESAPDIKTRMQLTIYLQQLQKHSNELHLLQRYNSALIQQGLNWTEATLGTFVQLGKQEQPKVYGYHGSEEAWQRERSMCDYNA